MRDPENNIWIWNLSGKTFTRVTTDAALDAQPAWTSDDRWIVFSSNRADGITALWRQAADGTGVPERLTHGPRASTNPYPTPDGTRLILSQPSAAGDTDVMELGLGSPHQLSPLLQTPLNEA